MNRREFLGTLTLLLTGCNSKKYNRKRNHFIEWAETNVKINHWEYGLIPYRATKHHKELADIFEKQDRVIVKKYRNGGFSTFGTIWSSYQCLEKENQNYIIFSRTMRECWSFYDMAVNILSEMPDKTRPTYTGRENTIQFENGSKIQFISSTFKFNGIPDCIIYDEAAFNPKVEKIHEILKNQSQKIFAISTVNGKGNWFYNNYISGDWYNYVPLWSEHPRYGNEEFVKKLRSNLGELGWRQEILGEFF